MSDFAIHLLVFAGLTLGFVLTILGLIAMCSSIPVDCGCGNVGDEE
jgi:hypothetical protein